MAFTASAVFRSYITDMAQNTTAFDDADTITCALYNNTGTPDKDATSANSAYNVSAWATANEVFQAGQWAQGGVNLTSPAITNPGSGITMFDSVDPSSGSAATLAAVFGCLIYDNTLTTPVADQGMSFNYFGGTNTVTGGTLTVIVNANGWYRITN